jgi:hypothetical protein
MLGAAIQIGLDQRDTNQSGMKDKEDSAGSSSNNKQKAEADPSVQNKNQKSTEPATKLPHKAGPT